MRPEPPLPPRPRPRDVEVSEGVSSALPPSKSTSIAPLSSESLPVGIERFLVARRSSWIDLSAHLDPAGGGAIS
eukprot:3314885-Pleurochrysis_carterae.AAC.1